MIGAIWCSNIKAGQEELDKIIKSYNLDNIQLKQRSTSEFITTVYFDNFDIWYLNYIPSNQKDKRYYPFVNVSHVERNISKNLFVQVIQPTTRARPFQAYHFFGEGERWLI